jgi:hypothetical protein
LTKNERFLLDYFLDPSDKPWITHAPFGDPGGELAAGLRSPVHTAIAIPAVSVIVGDEELDAVEAPPTQAEEEVLQDERLSWLGHFDRRIWWPVPIDADGG